MGIVASGGIVRIEALLKGKGEGGRDVIRCGRYCVIGDCDVWIGFRRKQPSTKRLNAQIGEFVARQSTREAFQTARNLITMAQDIGRVKGNH